MKCLLLVALLEDNLQVHPAPLQAALSILHQQFDCYLSADLEVRCLEFKNKLPFL
jgi:hypothetical protein